MNDESRIYHNLEGKSPKEICTVGQLVYLIPDNNRRRGLKGSIFKHATEHYIEKIGNKFITVNDIKFEISCGYIREKSNFASDYNLILSKEDLENVIELDGLDSIIGEFFSIPSRYSKYDKINIEDKRRIANILENYL